MPQKRCKVQKNAKIASKIAETNQKKKMVSYICNITEMQATEIIFISERSSILWDP